MCKMLCCTLSTPPVHRHVRTASTVPTLYRPCTAAVPQAINQIAGGAPLPPSLQREAAALMQYNPLYRGLSEELQHLLTGLVNDNQLQQQH